MFSSTIPEQMNKTRQMQSHRFWNRPGMKPCWGWNKPMSQPACNVFVHARNKALRGRQFQSLTDRQSIQGCSNVKQTKNVYFTTYYSIQLILEDSQSQNVNLKVSLQLDKMLWCIFMDWSFLMDVLQCETFLNAFIKRLLWQGKNR